MNPDLAQDVIQQWEQLDGERLTWLTHWQKCANYLLPNRNDYIVEKTPGQRRNQYIFDSTPVWVNEMFAAGMQDLSVSQVLPWFGLKTFDERLNKLDSVRLWLDDTTDRMLSLYNSERHNFATSVHEMFLDLGCIGTGIMAQLESNRSGILFSTRHAKECVFTEDEEGRVDTLIRKWQYTAKQAVQAWGDAAGKEVTKVVEATPLRKFTFYHAVRPRLRRDPARFDAMNKPWQSVYVCHEGKHVIAEGGFNEFPYHVPRWSKASGEIPGRGPGILMLDDIQMLNEMQRTVLKGAQKVVDPPLQLPDDGFLVPIKTSPGSLNYYRAGSRDRVEPIETKGDTRLGIEMLNSLRQNIIRGFYVDMLLLQTDPGDPASAGKGVTATYTLHQRDQHMRLLTGVQAHMRSEFNGPLIDRTFNIMMRQSMARRFGPGSLFTRPPPELRGVPLRVEYVSPISLAQRASRLDGIGRLTQTAQLLATVDPNAPKVLDTEAIMRIAASSLNTPAAALKTPERMQAEAQQAAQAQAELNAHAQALSQAKALRDGADGLQSLSAAVGGVPAAQEAA